MSEAAVTTEPTLKRTPLHDLHVRLGARMVPFAGYEMPVQYRDGILAEHSHTRAAAGLFDVSHMGQAFLVAQDHATAARALETLVPADIATLAPGRQRYTQFLNPDGGILDDLMVTRSAEPEEDGTLMLVVNASRKEADFAHLAANLPSGVRLMLAPHRALLALQGPGAHVVLAKLTDKDIHSMPFMSARMMRVAGVDCHVSRSGYTGEDGFELSVHEKRVLPVAQALLSQPEVKPIGLGARDSLRLEAGLCLFGHDIDETSSPIEAGLTWSIQKRRREEGGFLGAERIQRELAEGAPRRRVGLLPEGRAPAREGARILAADGADIGLVTSGGFGPSVGGPVAMGYVTPRFAEPGTPVLLVVRDKKLVAKVAPLPFIPHRYRR
jgi:aminomethyltransferase